MADGHNTAEKNNYRVTFHPAFASRCAITGEDGECEVYKQSEPHKLNGQSHPTRHTIRLQGGKYNRDITLDVNDPKLAIKQIRLELYGDRDPAHIGDSTYTYDAAEVFTTDNTADLCPPMC